MRICSQRRFFDTSHAFSEQTLAHFVHWGEADPTFSRKMEFVSLGSKTAKLAAVKEQLRIRTIGLGWTDLHHPWSKNCEDYSPEHLRDYLIKTVIPEKTSERSQGCRR